MLNIPWSLRPFAKLVAIVLVSWLLAVPPTLGQNRVPGGPGGSGGGVASPREQEPSQARAVASWALGVGAALSFLLFLIQLVRGDGPQIESHWGGFGGGLGGWRLSPSAALLIITLVLSSMAAMLIAPVPKEEKKDSRQGEAAKGTSPAGVAPNPVATPAPTTSGTP